MSPSARPATFVSDPTTFDALLPRLASAPALAIDTESNSFFAYRERTCLVQVSTADEDLVLDPFALDLTKLGPMLADAAIEKVFHAGELDVMQLHRDYGLRIHNLFDTQIAAKAVGRKRVGYASVVEDLLGEKLEKDEQRSDWGRRPLTPKQLAYAFADTRYLLTVAAKLKVEVASKGALVEEEVAVDCRRLAEKESKPRESDPDAFERHPSARKLDPVSRQVLRSLYLARERIAVETDKPLFRIVGDEVLGELAARKLVTFDPAIRIPGLTPAVVGRHGEWLFAAVREALEAGPLGRRPRTGNAPDLAEEERFESLRAWRKKLAEARAVEVDVIAGNAALKAIAKAFPRSIEALAAVPELDVFRKRVYGEAIVRAMK